MTRWRGNRPQTEPDVPVEIEIDIVSAVPPWENGALLPEAKRVLDEQDEGGLMGGPRFEQLSRATGSCESVTADIDIDGGALRIRRQGIRRLGTFRGHAWQSALFPERAGFRVHRLPASRGRPADLQRGLRVRR